MQTDDPTPHLERFDSYEQACRDFSPLIPEHFNIATAICRRQPDAITRIALKETRPGGNNTYTFGALDFLSDKLATSLSEAGLVQGDVVGVTLPPSAALAVAHLGALKAGGVVAPLPLSWGADLSGQALFQSKARFAVVDESIFDTVDSLRRQAPSLAHLYVARDVRSSSMATHKDFWYEVDRASSDFNTVEAEARSPAFIFYYQSNGKLSSVIQSHASVICQLAGFEMCSNLEVDLRAVWFINNWSSVTGLLAIVYPAWWYGCSLVASNDDDDLITLLQQCKVNHAFISAPRLSVLTREARDATGPSNLELIVSDSPASAEARQDFGRRPGPKLATVYENREAGVLAATCPRWYSASDGSSGRPVPGRSIKIIDDNGAQVTSGEEGRITFRATAAGVPGLSGDWVVTGDVGYTNDQGDLVVNMRK